MKHTEIRPLDDISYVIKKETGQRLSQIINIQSDITLATGSHPSGTGPIALRPCLSTSLLFSIFQSSSIHFFSFFFNAESFLSFRRFILKRKSLFYSNKVSKHFPPRNNLSVLQSKV